MKLHGQQRTRKRAIAALAVLLFGLGGLSWAAGRDRLSPLPPPAHAEPAAAAKELPAPPQARETPSASPARAAALHAEPEKGVPVEDALRMLLEGNDRVVKGKTRGPNRTLQRRGEVAAGQHPFAIVITCSDSRVPPELLFDQGYGDLFVVRTAGNVVDDVALGSIEYAVEHLGARLIVVLGHSKCGAVKATVEGGELPGHLPAIAEAIRPAVDSVRSKPGDLVANAVRANVRLVVQKIMESGPGFVEKLEDCVLRIAGGVYDLDTGKVQLTYQPVM